MSLNRSHASTRLLEFISGKLLQRQSDLDLQSGDDLLASGLLDSLGVMRLVDFVESDFSVSVPPADVTIEHFMTVDTIVSYLESRLDQDEHSAGA